jgi:predicted Zn-dependent protease
LLLNRDKDAGLAQIGAILKQAPDYVPARVRLAQIALADKDYDTVRKEAAAVTSRDPQNVEVRQLEAQMYLATNEEGKAQDIMN